MSRIHPVVFIVLGLVISVISYFAPKLIVFMYVGIAVILYGIIGLLFFLPKKVQATHHSSYSGQSTEHQAYPKCPLCKKHIHNTFRFCPYCGHKVK